MNKLICTPPHLPPEVCTEGVSRLAPGDIPHQFEITTYPNQNSLLLIQAFYTSGAEESVDDEVFRLMEIGLGRFSKRLWTMRLFGIHRRTPEGMAGALKAMLEELQVSESIMGPRMNYGAVMHGLGLTQWGVVPNWLTWILGA